MTNTMHLQQPRRSSMRQNACARD